MNTFVILPSLGAVHRVALCRVKVAWQSKQQQQQPGRAEKRNNHPNVLCNKMPKLLVVNVSNRNTKTFIVLQESILCASSRNSLSPEPDREPQRELDYPKSPIDDRQNGNFN